MANKAVAYIVVAGLIAGWAVFLAGVARGNDLCVKVAKGTVQPFDVSTSSTSTAGTLNDLNAANMDNMADLEAAAAALAAQLGARRLLSNGRELLGQIEDKCGIDWSFEWWVVALQFVNVVAAVLLAMDKATSKRSAFVALLAVNCALMCGIANQYVPEAYSYTKPVSRKGAVPTATSVLVAGVIVSLVFSFVQIFVASDTGDASVAPQ